MERGQGGVWMETAAGKSILGQLVLGRLQFFSRAIPQLTCQSQLGSSAEEARFQRAQQEAILELADFYDQAAEEVGEKTASIFAIHAMLLEDDDFTQSVQAMIRTQGVTAEYAVRSVSERLERAFSDMDSPYMRARAKDFLDISRRVIRLLLGMPTVDPLRNRTAILVVDEILPSELMELDRHHLLGLIARRGSVYSHAAQLLRAYHIPAMAEVGLGEHWEEHMALLDGYAQRLYLDPDQDLIDRLRRRYGQEDPAAKDWNKQKEPQTV